MTTRSDTAHHVIAHLARAVILALATTRATRLVTEDTVTEWVVKTPLLRYLSDHPDAEIDASADPNAIAWEDFTSPSWAKYLYVLDCPHCAGVWLSAAATVVEALAPHLPRPLRRAWIVATTTLALAQVVSNLSQITAVLDDPDQLLKGKES